MAEKFFVWLKDCGKGEFSLVGSKAHSIGAMNALGLPVPLGFVVTTEAYKLFIEEAGIKDKLKELLKEIDLTNIGSLQAISVKIQSLFYETPVPDEIRQGIVEHYTSMELNGNASSMLKADKYSFVAVRSSAYSTDAPRTSFSGHQTSLLNVRGNDAVVNAVKACWASLFMPRALVFRERNNFSHDNILAAVAVQKMIRSTISGLVFTVNTANNSDNEMLVEACYGIGEPMLSGSVTPDVYTVDKKKHQVTDVDVQEQDWAIYIGDDGRTIKKNILEADRKARILNDRQILELAGYGIILENTYKKPMSFEFAYENDKFYVVQCRPIKLFKQKK